MRPKIVKVSGKPTRLSISPDGKFVYLTGYGCNISVFSFDKQSVVSTVELEEQPKEIFPPVFSKDGTMAIISVFWSDGGLGCGYVSIWDWNPPKLKHKIIGHRPGFGGWEAIWAPDNKRLVTTGNDYTAKVWDANTGKKIVTRRAKKEGIMSEAFSPDGRYLAVGCEFGYVTVFDFATYQEKYTLFVGRVDVRNLSFSPDSSSLLVACGTSLTFFEAETGIEKIILPSNCFWHHVVAPKGNLIACSHSIEGKRPWVMAVHLWDLQKQRCLATLPAKEGKAAIAFSFSPDGMFLAVSYDGPFAFSPDGSILAVTNDKVELWEIKDFLKLGVDRSQFGGKTPHAVISTDKRTGVERAADMAVKRTKPTDGIKGMRFPAHLAKCLVRVQSKCSGTKCFGHVQCSCGNRNLKLATTNGFYEQNEVKRPQTVKSNGQYFFAIKALCPACGLEFLLFDANKHGWNAVCVPGTRSTGSPPLVPWQCSTCDQEEHHVSVGIVGEPMQVAIEESGELLDETNWQEGFGSINISIACCGCKNKVQDWVIYETM